MLRALRIDGAEAEKYYRSRKLSPEDFQRRLREKRKAEAKRVRQAVEIFKASVPAAGTLAERYLANRHLVDPLPDAIRFHPGAWHSDLRRKCPAMVSLFQHGVTDEPMGVHRTFLTSDGFKISDGRAKMMLGRTSGGAIRLGKWTEGNELIVSEGIETGLSVQQFMRGRGDAVTAWAAGSANGIKALELHPCIRRILIASDPGEVGQKAADEAATRWAYEEREVRIARPPGTSDFNDILITGKYQ